MRKQWNEFVPDQPFEYSILEDDLDEAYSDDLRTGTVFTVFTILAIFVSLMGLIGLASYVEVRRTKEIGIRKALGARVPQLVRILTREVVLYIVLASFIAWPAAWFFMKNWLQNFAFRVDPGLPYYLLASVSALFVAMLVVELRAYLAATANPADSLRYE
jgi:putative ABC transport system permease protein